MDRRLEDSYPISNIPFAIFRNGNSHLSIPGRSMLSQYYNTYYPPLFNETIGNEVVPSLIGAFSPCALPFRCNDFPNNTLNKKGRSEKKSIPEEQKDDKYYERRKRNNQAAKKSRDARKMREDQISLKATLLEHENALLRAQLLTMREETQCLRNLLLSPRKPDDQCSREADSTNAIHVSK